MWRRSLCIVLLIGSAACWAIYRERQFFEPGLGLWFAPLRAARPLLQFAGESFVPFVYFFGILSGALLTLAGFVIAVAATFSWVALAVLPSPRTAQTCLARGASLLGAAFGLVLLLGSWGIRGTEEPPPFDPNVLWYPAVLIATSPFLWPWTSVRDAESPPFGRSGQTGDPN